MSRRAMTGALMVLGLVVGCADEGDDTQGEPTELAAGSDADEVGNADHGAGDEGEVEVGERRDALTAPSFALISQQSSKAMTATTLSAGTLVVQQNLLGSKGSPNQRWVSVNQSITPESKPNLCLQPESTASSARVRLQTCNGSALQGWRLELKLQNGVKLTRWANLATGFYLDNGGTNSLGAAMVARPFSGLASQLFSRLF